jgi:prepilin-type processing-associated H-X9-DG protein
LQLGYFPDPQIDAKISTRIAKVKRNRTMYVIFILLFALSFLASKWFLNELYDSACRARMGLICGAADQPGGMITRFVKERGRYPTNLIELLRQEYAEFPSNDSDQVPESLKVVLHHLFDRRSGVCKWGDVDDWSDYIYIYWPADLVANDKPLMYDKSDELHKRGVNVMYVDGRVKFDVGCREIAAWHEKYPDKIPLPTKKP